MKLENYKPETRWVYIYNDRFYCLQISYAENEGAFLDLKVCMDTSQLQPSFYLMESTFQ